MRALAGNHQRLEERAGARPWRQHAGFRISIYKSERQVAGFRRETEEGAHRGWLPKRSDHGEDGDGE